MATCVFCDIVRGEAEAVIAAQGLHTVAIVPLEPHVDGHLLVLPRQHVANAVEAPGVTGAVMAEAATLAGRLGVDCNLLTSVGPAATQTVAHLHVHILPRGEGDGLHNDWPWCRDDRA